MFDRRQEWRVIDRRCRLADHPIRRRFVGRKVDHPARCVRPSRPNGIGRRRTRGQDLRHGLGIWLRRRRGLIDRDGSSGRFGRARRDRLFGGIGFGRNGGRCGACRRRLRPDRSGRKRRRRRLGGELGQDVLEAFELCRARFLEAIQPLNRVIFQPGADRVRQPRRLKAGLSPVGSFARAPATFPAINSATATSRHIRDARSVWWSPPRTDRATPGRP